MIVTIRNALPATSIDRIDKLASEVEFIKEPKMPRVHLKGKAAQQPRKDDPALKEIRSIIVNGLMRNEAFTSAALPLRMTAPALNYAEPGMQDGEVIQMPLVAGSPSVRTDLAMMLFLTPKDAYDGGELAISTDVGTRRLKLDRGGLVLYSTSATHRVEPVSRGSRLAIVSWVQSLVRQRDHRALLAELARIEALALKGATTAQTSMHLRRARATLVRMWAET